MKKLTIIAATAAASVPEQEHIMQKPGQKPGLLPGGNATAKWPDPTPEMLASPQFEAIWQCIKRWDINVPDVYGGYCGANGNHVRAILDALTAAAEVGEQDNDLNSVLLGFTNYVMNERVRAYNEGVDATIERCVQVADDMAYVETCADDTARGTANAAPYRKVAAEIRAMKDKP